MKKRRKRITLSIKYEMGSNDGQFQYYLVDEDDLREQLKKHVPEIDYQDFVLSTKGFITTDRNKKVQQIIGVRRERLGELIELNVVPNLPEE